MKLKEIISQVDWNEVAIAIVTERPYQRPVLAVIMHTEVGPHA